MDNETGFVPSSGIINLRKDFTKFEGPSNSQTKYLQFRKDLLKMGIKNHLNSNQSPNKTSQDRESEPRFFFKKSKFKFPNQSPNKVTQEPSIDFKDLMPMSTKHATSSLTFGKQQNRENKSFTSMNKMSPRKGGVKGFSHQLEMISEMINSNRAGQKRSLSESTQKNIKFDDSSFSRGRSRSRESPKYSRLPGLQNPNMHPGNKMKDPGPLLAQKRPKKWSRISKNDSKEASPSNAKFNMKQWNGAEAETKSILEALESPEMVIDPLTKFQLKMATPSRVRHYQTRKRSPFSQSRPQGIRRNSRNTKFGSKSFDSATPVNRLQNRKILKSNSIVDPPIPKRPGRYDHIRKKSSSNKKQFLLTHIDYQVYHNVKNKYTNLEDPMKQKSIKNLKLKLRSTENQLKNIYYYMTFKRPIELKLNKKVKKEHSNLQEQLKFLKKLNARKKDKYLKKLEKNLDDGKVFNTLNEVSQRVWQQIELSGDRKHHLLKLRRGKVMNT